MNEAEIQECDVESLNPKGDRGECVSWSN